MTLAQRFSLPATYLRTIIENKIDMLPNAHLQGNMLYTDSFVRRHKARVRGLLSAVTGPTPLQTVQSKFALLDTLTHTQVKELIAERQLAGTLKGASGRATYVPDIHVRTQEKGVLSFFEQNGQVPYDMLERLGIKQPKVASSHRVSVDWNGALRF